MQQSFTPQQPAEDLDSLKEIIVKRYGSLSPRLKQVADYLLEHPSFIAIDTMATISTQANVPISTLNRFSFAMGFDAFSQIQVLFKNQYYLNNLKDYKDRINIARGHGLFNQIILWRFYKTMAP